MSTTTKRAAVDWSLTPRGVASTVTQATGALAAAAAVGELTHVNPVWGAGVAVAGALGHLAVSAHRAYAPSAIGYRLACWAGAGGWLTWALWDSHNLWSQPGIISLGAGALVAGIAAPLANNTRDNTNPSRALVLRRDARVGDDWTTRFRRVCNVNVQVTGIRQWQSGAGYDVHCQFPPGPHTIKTIRAAAEALATDARLPEGCGVEITNGGHRGEFIVRVSTVNRLHETTHYPADYSPRSILDPVQVGQYRDSSIAEMHLREASTLITGMKGSGKTNLLDVLTCAIGRCRDALVWHIDLNGGGMSQFWLNPWLEGEQDRPPVDWAASTPEEALLMVTVALAIAKDRKSAYRKFKAQANTKLLPVSDRLPQIVIMVDEGAEALSPTNRDPIVRQIRDGLEEVKRIARNEAVTDIVTSLRATQDMVSANTLKQSANRIGMYVQDEEELNYLYGYNKGISVADLPTMGCGFLGDSAAPPRPFKAWYLEPGQIKDAARVIGPGRPDLDDAGAEVGDGEFDIYLGGRRPEKMSGIYAGRYERMRAAFNGESLSLSTELEETPAVPFRPVVLQGGAADWPDPLGGVSQPAQTAPRDAANWPDPIASSRPAGVLTQAPVQAVPELLTRALAAFDSAGDDRMHSETLAQALGIGSTHELAALLAPLGVKTLPNKFMRGNVERRGYARQDFGDAARKVAAGEVEVPAEVADWPAA